MSQSPSLLLPELTTLRKIADKAAGNVVEVRQLKEVSYDKHSFPLLAFLVGKQDKNLPLFIFTAGVHGLERIGTQVLSAYLETFIELLSWDELTATLASKCRIVFCPMINPVGIFLKRRSNGNGVDLMRNAPIDADEKALRLIGGHRISPILPWYRGRKNFPMELELEAVHKFLSEQLTGTPFAMSLDVHSGFGLIDRLWFPHARTRKPLKHLAHAYGLNERLDRTLPHHIYRLEPQSNQYVTHGDLWDYLYDHVNQAPPHPAAPFYLPLTLEMGSWLWVKKNPKQLFSSLGVFHPVVPHRTQRVLRRHMLLFDFLVRLTANWQNFMRDVNTHELAFREQGFQKWYKHI